MNRLQQETIQSIVNLFETGRPQGDYARVTSAKGDPGGLTYGASQTTLNSGGLALLVADYVRAKGKFAKELKVWLPRIEAREPALNRRSCPLHDLLRTAGADPVMRRTQDAFFDRAYWGPSLQRASSLGIESGLGVLVVYDSKVHGSFERVRKMTEGLHGTAAGLGEQAWVRCYLMTRRDWLSNHRIRLLRRTVYRIDAMLELVERGAWDLALPLFVRGVRLNVENVMPDERAEKHPGSAEGPEDEVLRLGSRGEAVERLQAALGVRVDGRFGLKTQKAVRAFQRKKGLMVDGVVGPVTWAALEEHWD